MLISFFFEKAWRNSGAERERRAITHLPWHYRHLTELPSQKEIGAHSKSHDP